MRDWLRGKVLGAAKAPKLASRTYVIKCANCQEEIGLLTVSGQPLEQGVARSGEWSATHIYRCGSCLATKLGNTYSRPVEA